MVYVLLGDGFEECEALVPVDLLRRAGADVRIVAVDEMLVTGSHGVRVQADIPLQDVDVDEMEMLLLPGGTGGVESIRMNLFALTLINDAWNKGAYLAAICAAPTLLANLGILDRRKAVCFPDLESQMGSAVVMHGEQVIVDGHIITANAAGASFPFGFQLIETLYGTETMEEVKKSVHYKD